MATKVNIGIRTSTEVRDILEELAEEGFRSLSQQCEMIIIKWLREHGYLESGRRKKAMK